jgi:hypothetical protein
MAQPTGHDVYGAPYRKLVVRLGRAEMIASRTTAQQIGRSGTVSAQRCDMFGFAYQLAPLSGDEFWNDEATGGFPTSLAAAFTSRT